MSTRAVIARPEGEDFLGRYHHFDGYPSGLGSTLYRAWQEWEDKEALLRLLLDEHPAGWSTINGHDLRQPAGFRSTGAGEGGGPLCYCHGERAEEPWQLTAATSGGCAYAYVLEAGRGHMLVFGRGSGMGGSWDSWHLIADVDLAGPEPNWNGLQGF